MTNLEILKQELINHNKGVGPITEEKFQAGVEAGDADPFLAAMDKFADQQVQEKNIEITQLKKQIDELSRCCPSCHTKNIHHKCNHCHTSFH